MRNGEFVVCTCLCDCCLFKPSSNMMCRIKAISPAVSTSSLTCASPQSHLICCLYKQSEMRKRSDVGPFYAEMPSSSHKFTNDRWSTLSKHREGPSHTEMPTFVYKDINTNDRWSALTRHPACTLESFVRNTKLLKCTVESLASCRNRRLSRLIAAVVTRMALLKSS